MKLKFSDGVTIETAGPLRKLHLEDGWYVVGAGFCIPTASEEEADETILQMTEKKILADNEPNDDGIASPPEHLIFVLCCAQHKTNNVVVSVMLSSTCSCLLAFKFGHAWQH